MLYEVITDSIDSAANDAAADPVAVVLMLHQEAGNRQQDDYRVSGTLKQAEIKERVLRRMLEKSLERWVPAGKPHLKLIKSVTGKLG